MKKSFTRKRIMILGAGVYQVPLIKKAQEMGFETIVVSCKGKYPGIDLADIFLDIDTTDVERVTEAAREYGISGVATTGTDVCMPAMGSVVDMLDLPGTGYGAACRSMDKILMKRAFMLAAIPTAAFSAFDDPVEAKRFADHIGYPVMVKTTDSSGSRGITKVTAERRFAFAWERAKSVSRSKQIIVEQYLSGVEFGAQAFVHGDKVAAVFLHGDTVTPAPYFSPIGHSMPSSLTDNQQRKVEEVIEQAVRALGLRDCVSNVDLMLVDGEPMIIEMGARMGATCIPECISVYTGMDVYEHVIALAMGEHRDITVSNRQANAGLLLRSDKTGTVRLLDVPEDVLKHPDLIDLQWDISVGDQVCKFKVGPDRIGHILVKANTSQAGERLVECLASQLTITVYQEGERMP